MEWAPSMKIELIPTHTLPHKVWLISTDFIQENVNDSVGPTWTQGTNYVITALHSSPPGQNGRRFTDNIFSFHSCALQWRDWCHNRRDGISNHQPRQCLLNCLFRRKSKRTSKLRVTGLCEGNSPVTGEFPAQMASNAENVSIWWCHHGASVSS